MSYHDPIRQSKYLRQTLSQDKKPIGFFISAGCPLSVKMPAGSWPLIPDVAGLTSFIQDAIAQQTENLENSEKSVSKAYSLLIDELRKAQTADPNIEDILSFLRGLIQVSKGADSIRGFLETELEQLDNIICRKISEKLAVCLPDNKTPYHKLAKWVNNIERDRPIEIFTTNYDLLLEEAFESLKLPYFDGFVGTRFPFFDLRAVEDGLIPKHWTRLWKIHGSINWYLSNTKEVYRSTSLNEKDSYIIHPSHLKYDQSRKMPYLALLDRLNKFLRQPSSVLIMSGYSFSDDHLNDTIINALRANPTAIVIALLFGNLTDKIETSSENSLNKTIKIIVKYEKAVNLSENRSNLSIWALDEAIIGGLRAKWKPAKFDYSPEENIANAVKSKEVPILDNTGKETEDTTKEYQFEIGDFAILGDFLQELIGKDQFKLEQNGF